MNENPTVLNSEEIPETFFATTDLTVLVETIKSMSQENKNAIDELAKQQRSIYNDIIQKQNNELESYRQGAMQRSKLSVLRTVAGIYSDYCQDFETVENPSLVLSDVMSLIEELLENNDVQIIRSKPGEAFDRKYMRTQERYIIETNDPKKDREIGESIKPGFIHFGEPLVQELVHLYRLSASYDKGLISTEATIDNKPIDDIDQSLDFTVHEFTDGTQEFETLDKTIKSIVAEDINQTDFYLIK